MAQEVITLAKQETSEEILEIVKGLKTTARNIQTGLNTIDGKMVMDGKIWSAKRIQDSIKNTYDTSSRTILTLNALSGRKRLLQSASIKITANYANTEASNNAWGEIHFNGKKIAKMIPIGSSGLNNLLLLSFTTEEVQTVNEHALGADVTKEYTKVANYVFHCTSFPEIKSLILFAHARQTNGAGYGIAIEWDVIYYEEELGIPIK